MNIRAWLGYNNPLVQVSQVDKKVENILTYFHKITLNFVNGSEFNNIMALESFLKDEENAKDIYIGFKNWFFEEGKDFLVHSAKFLYSDNQILCEELDYLEFVISAESSFIDEYPEELIGILVDISDQFNELMKEAEVVAVLANRYARSFSHLDNDFLKNNHQTTLNNLNSLNNLNYWSDSKGQDSYRSCENLFFVLKEEEYV